MCLLMIARTVFRRRHKEHELDFELGGSMRMWGFCGLPADGRQIQELQLRSAINLRLSISDEYGAAANGVKFTEKR
jgi:hypothetical protein